MLLARADGSPQRFYSLSAQIQRERKDYYDILERTQKGTMDVTEWLAWFLGTLRRAVDRRRTRWMPCCSRRASGSAGPARR